MAHTLTINQERLWQSIESLSRFTDQDKPWTRRAFSPLFMKGRDWLSREYADAGLSVDIDAGGNLIGRLSGHAVPEKAIVSGSHSDTVPAGGRFDGILGVLAAIEVAHTLTEKGVVLRHPFEVVDFLSEEPSDFGLSCIGSRAYVGALEQSMLSITRPDGRTLAEGIADVGGRPNELYTAVHMPGSIAAFLEVHIEQGPVLETRGTDVGVVTGIAGIHREKVIFTGRADHSGTTPMDIRCDALVGASKLIDEVHGEAVRIAGEGRALVATIGKLDVLPNAANAVPEAVELTLEVRSGEADALRQFIDDVFAKVELLLTPLRVGMEHSEISHVVPTPCADFLQDAVEKGAARHGYSTYRMPSGAGHDGVFVSHAAPIGMIFTACENGRSHTPVEFADADTCAKGANTLLSTVLALDEELDQ
jgi:N-carbamoyl-L-amino-acid hydrolase